MNSARPYYLFGSRILTHVLFWIGYFVLFSLIWSRGEYLRSFYLEFILLPIRIMAVYLSIYVLLPKYLKDNRLGKTVVSYIVLLALSAILQRVFIYFFYEGMFLQEERPLLSLFGLGRSMILINSTVLFVTAVKIIFLLQEERKRNELLSLALQERDSSKGMLEVRADKRVYHIPTAKIFYIEGLGNYVTYHLKDQKVISYISLKECLSALSDNFVRIHKSFIINKDHITSHNQEDVEINGDYLPIGRSYREKIDLSPTGQ